MVITKNYVNEIFRTVLVLSALLSTASAVDCNGKSFRCVNSTHFMICVDLGGVSQAIDDFFIACPRPTVCESTNQFECEFPAPTTPSTTLTKVISETTLPWEEVVTASSPRNASKEFSENYLNTERITTTVEYSVTTDAAVDLTAAASLELYVNNELKTPASAVEITTIAIETTPTVNENLNIIEYVPTVEAADITTTVVETIIHTPAESKNLTEIESEIVEITTTPAVETTSENIIITDTIAAETEDIVPSVTKQVIYTIIENPNITEKPTGIDKDNTTTIIEPVMQTTVKNQNLTETENVAVNEITATAIEITTDIKIIADRSGTELGYIEPTATGPGTPTTNYNFLELVTGESNTESSQVTILPQNVSAKTNVLLKEPSMEHTNPLTIEKAISSKLNNITVTSTEVPSSKIKNATRTENVVQDILPVQTTATVEAIVETTTVSKELLTTISVDRIVDDEAVNVSHVFEESVRSNNSIVVNKKPVDNKIGNKETQMPTINSPGVPDNSATRISSTTSHEAKENVKYTITNKTVHEKDYTTITNVPTDQNPAETKVFDGIWTEKVDHVTSTDQPTKINEESLITVTTQNFVIENIIKPTSQAVNLEMITTDVVPTTVSNAQPITTAFEDNMNIETSSSVTENIVSTVNNGASTNDLETAQSVNMDTITTDAMHIPTTINNAQSMPPTFEDNMKIETPSPVTENIVSTVNNGASTNDLATVQSVNMDTITTDAMDIPTTISNAQSKLPTFEDNIKIETPLLATENIVSAVNNGTSTNDLVTVQSVNMNTITTEPMDILTTISNVQSMPPTIEDNMKDETPSPVTENIVSTVNNGASINDVVTIQSVNMDTITTEAMDIATTISNVQSMPSTIEDNMKIETPSPVTEKIVSAVNNGASKNDLVTVQSVNMDTITTDAMDIPTTISNAQSKLLTFEDNIKIETPSPVTENIVSTVNNGASINGVVTIQSVNMDTITTDAMDIPTTISNAQSNLLTFEDNIKIETPSPVTENIVSRVNNGASINGVVTIQSVNMDTITTDAMDIPTTISNAQSKLLTFEDNIKIETPSPVTENIVSTVNNGASINGVVTIQSVNMDTITTDAMDIPTTISNAQSNLLTFEDNIKIETPSPVTENIVSTVNNGASINGVVTIQSVNTDTITTEAMDIATTISNVQSMPSTIEDNMKIETPSPVTENIVSTVNNGASINGVVTIQSVNMDTITTEAMDIASTISNVQSMPSTIEDNMKIDTPSPVTENIVSTVNNGASKNDLVTVQSVNTDTITTEAMDIATTISNVQSMPSNIEDNMKIETPSPVTENIVSAIRNGASTNGLVTVQSVNMDTITIEATDIPTTISNVQSIPSTFEDNMKIETPSPVTENMLSTVNNGASTNGVVTVHSVNMDTVTTAAMDIPTTISNVQSMPSTSEDNIKIETPLLETENIVSAVNNGASTNGLVAVTAVNMDTLTTEAMHIPTTMSNAQPMPPDFEDNMKTARPLSNENIVSTVNNKVDTNDFMSVQELDLDIINTDAMYTPTTVGNGQAPTFGDNMKTEAPLPATGNILSSVNNETSTNSFMTSQPVNVDVINTEAMYIPTTANNVQPMPPTFEGSKRTDVQLPATADSLSSVNNGVSTNGLKAAQPVNLDVVNTEAMYIQTITIPSTAPTFNDIKTIEASFPATKNIIAAINNKDSTNGFMTAKTIDLEQITQKGEFETGVQSTTDTYTVPVKNVIELSFNKEKTLETDHEGSPENATSVPDIIEDSPENAIQKPQIILNSSANTAVESDVNGNYEDNKVATISTNYMIETEDIREQLLPDLELSLNNTHNSTTIFIGVENTENTYLNSYNNQNVHNMSIINTVTENENAILENVIAQVSVDNVATSQTETTINNNIVIATKIKSIPTLGLDSALDISNQNLIRQEGDSKTKQTMANLQPSIVEHNAQANNIIWNPLANHVLDMSNPNSESVGTSSVTNINAEAHDRITATLNTKLASQQTTNSVITGSPIYANINDREQSIDSITTERSSRSTVVEIEISLRKSGNNTEVYMDNLEDINAKSNQDPSIVSTSITSDNKSEVKSSDIKDGYIISPIVVYSNQLNLPTYSDGSTETNRVGTPMDANKVNEEDDTLSKPEMMDVLPLPININFSAPITNILILKDLTSKSQAENTAIVRTSDIATVPTIEDTALDTPTSDFVTKNGDATFNSQARSIDGTDVMSKPSQHVEKVTNKKASAPNNTYVRPDSKPSGTSTNTDNPYNINSPTFTNNVKTEIITPKSVSESHKSENITHTVSHVNNNLNKQVPTDTAPTYSCIIGIRGRYSDKNDCKKFYICFGNSEPIVGHCPENTVFSDLKKLCTRNMSHCIRENQFKCPSVGRFSDFMKDDIYYICVNHNSKLYRLKFQCQKGYILDKATVKCIETKEIESNESVSISSSDNTSQTSSSAISSSSSSKSISSNKAPETSDQSEGKEDEEDDEVFKCKKEGKFPIPNECRRYYLCKKNRKSEYRRKIKKCDSGKVFHKNKKKCVDNDRYEC